VDPAVLLFVPVAVNAFARCVLVNHDLFVADRSRLNMALGTGDICVPTGQGRVRLGVMVEGGRRPSFRAMAIGAMGLIVLGQKLPVVSVPMAVFALCRRPLEARLGVRSRLMAISACHGSMCSQ